MTQHIRNKHGIAFNKSYKCHVEGCFFKKLLFPYPSCLSVHMIQYHHDTDNMNYSQAFIHCCLNPNRASNLTQPIISNSHHYSMNVGINTVSQREELYFAQQLHAVNNTGTWEANSGGNMPHPQIYTTPVTLCWSCQATSSIATGEANSNTEIRSSTPYDLDPRGLASHSAMLPHMHTTGSTASYVPRNDASFNNQMASEIGAFIQCGFCGRDTHHSQYPSQIPPISRTTMLE